MYAPKTPYTAQKRRGGADLRTAKKPNKTPFRASPSSLGSPLELLSPFPPAVASALAGSEDGDAARARVCPDGWAVLAVGSTLLVWHTAPTAVAAAAKADADSSAGSASDPAALVLSLPLSASVMGDTAAVSRAVLFTTPVPVDTDDDDNNNDREGQPEEQTPAVTAVMFAHPSGVVDVWTIGPLRHGMIGVTAHVGTNIPLVAAVRGTRSRPGAPAEVVTVAVGAGATDAAAVALVGTSHGNVFAVAVAAAGALSSGQVTVGACELSRPRAKVGGVMQSLMSWVGAAAAGTAADEGAPETPAAAAAAAMLAAAPAAGTAPSGAATVAPSAITAMLPSFSLAKTSTSSSRRHRRRSLAPVTPARGGSSSGSSGSNSSNARYPAPVAASARSAAEEAAARTLLVVSASHVLTVTVPRWDALLSACLSSAAPAAVACVPVHATGAAALSAIAASLAARCKVSPAALGAVSVAGADATSTRLLLLLSAAGMEAGQRLFVAALDARNTARLLSGRSGNGAALAAAVGSLHSLTPSAQGAAAIPVTSIVPVVLPPEAAGHPAVFTAVSATGATARAAGALELLAVDARSPSVSLGPAAGSSAAAGMGADASVVTLVTLASTSGCSLLIQIPPESLLDEAQSSIEEAAADGNADAASSTLASMPAFSPVGVVVAAPGRVVMGSGVAFLGSTAADAPAKHVIVTDLGAAALANQPTDPYGLSTGTDAPVFALSAPVAVATAPVHTVVARPSAPATAPAAAASSLPAAAAAVDDWDDAATDSDFASSIVASPAYSTIVAAFTRFVATHGSPVGAGLDPESAFPTAGGLLVSPVMRSSLAPWSSAMNQLPGTIAALNSAGPRGGALGGAALASFAVAGSSASNIDSLALTTAAAVAAGGQAAAAAVAECAGALDCDGSYVEHAVSRLDVLVTALSRAVICAVLDSAPHHRIRGAATSAASSASSAATNAPPASDTSLEARARAHLDLLRFLRSPSLQTGVFCPGSAGGAVDLTSVWELLSPLARHIILEHGAVVTALPLVRAAVHAHTSPARATETATSAPPPAAASAAAAAVDAALNGAIAAVPAMGARADAMMRSAGYSPADVFFATPPLLLAFLAGLSGRAAAAAGASARAGSLPLPVVGPRGSLHDVAPALVATIAAAAGPGMAASTGADEACVGTVAVAGAAWEAAASAVQSYVADMTRLFDREHQALRFSVSLRPAVSAAAALDAAAAAPAAAAAAEAADILPLPAPMLMAPGARAALLLQTALTVRALVATLPSTDPRIAAAAAAANEASGGVSAASVLRAPLLAQLQSLPRALLHEYSGFRSSAFASATRPSASSTAAAVARAHSSVRASIAGLVRAAVLLHERVSTVAAAAAAAAASLTGRAGERQTQQAAQAAADMAAECPSWLSLVLADVANDEDAMVALVEADSATALLSAAARVSGAGLEEVAETVAAVATERLETLAAAYGPNFSRRLISLYDPISSASSSANDTPAAAAATVAALSVVIVPLPPAGAGAGVDPSVTAAAAAGYCSSPAPDSAPLRLAALPAPGSAMHVCPRPGTLRARLVRVFCASSLSPRVLWPLVPRNECGRVPRCAAVAAASEAVRRVRMDEDDDDADSDEATALPERFALDESTAAEAGHRFRQLLRAHFAAAPASAAGASGRARLRWVLETVSAASAPATAAHATAAAAKASAKATSVSVEESTYIASLAKLSRLAAVADFGDAATAPEAEESKEVECEEDAALLLLSMRSAMDEHAYPAAPASTTATAAAGTASALVARAAAQAQSALAVGSEGYDAVKLAVWRGLVVAAVSPASVAAGTVSSKAGARAAAAAAESEKTVLASLLSSAIAIDKERIEALARSRRGAGAWAGAGPDHSSDVVSTEDLDGIFVTELAAGAAALAAANTGAPDCVSVPALAFPFMCYDPMPLTRVPGPALAGAAETAFSAALAGLDTQWSAEVKAACVAAWEAGVRRGQE